MKKRAMANASVRQDTTRMRIMDAAIKLFASKGYASTSIKDISAAAKVNIAAVNYHFESKENLYCELMRRISEKGLSNVQRILKPPVNREEFQLRLEMFLNSGIDNLVEFPDMPRMLLKNMDILPRQSEEAFSKTFEQFHNVTIEFFRAAQKKGIIRKELKVEVIARFLQNQMHSLIHQIGVQRNLKVKDIDTPEFRERWLDQTLNVFFNGILEKSK